MREEFTGIILAGGQSRRMGQAKARLAWHGTTLIRHVIETLRPTVDELLVVVKDAGQLPGLNARVVEDLVPDAHALGGLYTGLRAASHEHGFVCACDAPFVSPRLIRALTVLADGHDLVIPETEQGLQPLLAVYAKSALPAIEAQLRQRQWDLRALVPKLRARIIGPGAMHRLDPEGASFVNLNTPEDYADALRFDGRMTSIIDPVPSLG